MARCLANDVARQDAKPTYHEILFLDKLRRDAFTRLLVKLRFNELSLRILIHATRHLRTKFTSAPV